MASVNTPIDKIFIVNKAGGLIYHKDFSPNSKLTANDYLRLASTFHGLHAITCRGIHNFGHPNPSGIVNMETRDFRLRCFQTLTGVKFIVTASSSYPDHMLQKMLQGLYVLFAEYVNKNPFYELDMPIEKSSAKFTEALMRLITTPAEEGKSGRRSNR